MLDLTKLLNLSSVVAAIHHHTRTVINLTITPQEEKPERRR